jgi:hypothetical protein
MPLQPYTSRPVRRLNCRGPSQAQLLPASVSPGIQDQDHILPGQSHSHSHSHSHDHLRLMIYCQSVRVCGKSLEAAEHRFVEPTFAQLGTSSFVTLFHYVTIVYCKCSILDKFASDEIELEIVIARFRRLKTRMLQFTFISTVVPNIVEI